MRRPAARAALTAIAAAAAGCVPAPPPPPPQSDPVAVPATPPPPPMPSPAPSRSWEDTAATAGGWSYRPAPAEARFGTAGAPLFVVRCERPGRVALVRAGAAGRGPLTLRTSASARTLPAAAEDSGLTAYLAASDPLLDAIAFSRGRFAVEAPGVAPLVVPAWPAPARVIEECR